jgi:hypothetical protein
MHDHEVPLHPRPQLARARWIDLRGKWSFTFDDSCQGLDERWQERSDVFQRTIQVPFPPESPASGIGDTTFHPVVWYRRSSRTLSQPLSDYTCTAVLWTTVPTSG